MLGGCSGFSALNIVTPDSGYVGAGNIAYARGAGRRLDIYTPAGLDDLAPVVVFFHGGRWSTGSKDDYKFVGEALSGRGFVAVVVDYRKYPDVRMAGFMEDAAQAVRWVRDNISTYGGDNEQIFLMGHSSGAHMAALLSYNLGYLQRAGLRTPPRGFIGLAGAYDFLPIRDPDLLDIFGPQEGHGHSQPINFVTRAAPPTLLIHAENDATIRFANAQRLVGKLRSQGASATLVSYETIRCAPGVSSHACTVAVLARPYRRNHDLLDQIDAFIFEQVGRRVTTTPDAPAPLERGAPRPIEDDIDLQD